MAIINTTPNRPSFKPGESVLFDGSSSYVDGGASIVSYTWYVDGTQKKAGSSATTYTTSFSLSSGQNSKSVQVKLSLVADNGTSSSKTITITIIRDENKLYYLTDNVGSVRVTVDQYGDPVGYDDYYPFGKVMPGRSNNTSNPHDAYKFTGKELDQENGIDLEYFGARYYDPEIGRWLSVDPILNKKPDALVNKGYLNVSPYNYAFNNPAILVDPNGLSVNCDGCANETPRGEGFVQKIIKAFQVSVNNFKLPIKYGFLAGQNVQAKGYMIKGVDKAIKVNNTIGNVSADAKLVLSVAAIPTDGATLPAAGVAGAVTTTSDFVGAALYSARADLTGTSSHQPYIKLAQGTLDLVSDPVQGSLEGKLIRPTGEAVASTGFRSSISGRFVTNYYGHAIQGAGAAFSFVFFKTLFGN